MDYYKPLVHIVSADEDGLSLRSILRDRVRISRTLYARLKMLDRGITVNGERRYASEKLYIGDRIEIQMAVEESEDILPQNLPIKIVYEDDALLVVDKAAGMIVHPTHGHYLNTLANAVVYYWQHRGDRHRFRPIHRLDEETSGLVMIAKNAFVHQRVSEQLQSNSVQKQYLAIVHGVFDSLEGTVNGAIDRDPCFPHRRIVTGDAYPAVTHYRVLTSGNAASVISVRPETGRTHQIRVHMNHIGHPVIGDKFYHLPQFADAPGERWISRHALHAARLVLYHPLTNELLELEADVPEDMRILIDNMEVDLEI